MYGLPVVNRRAVHDFLYRRRLRNSDKVKRFTRAALLRKAEALGPDEDLWGLLQKLRTHQLASFLLGVKHPQYLFLLDMGLGKTLLDLVLFNYWRREGRASRCLVLVPNTTNIDAWRREVRKHVPHLRVAGIDGDREDRLEALDSGADVVVCTYMGWLSLVCPRKKDCKKCNATGLVPGKREHKKCPACKGRGWTHLKLRVSESLFKRHARAFDMVVFDEVTAAANPKSLTHRVCSRLARQCGVRYGLTGTPFGRDPQALWGIFFLIDRGETLGETLGLFRTAFFTSSRNFWSGGYDWTFDKRKSRLLYAMIRHNSVRYSEDECADLPPKVKSLCPVRLPAETRAYYEKLVEEIRDAKGNRAVVDNVFVRMRQLASGYLTVKDDQGKVAIRFDKNPKLDALLERIENMPRNRKAIVFHEYRVSGDIVCEGLKARKIPYRVLRGGMGRKGQHQVEQFLDNKKYKVLVSSSAGAYGGNWQKANYVHFYESTPNPMVRRQEEKRAHRDGQRRTVFYFDYPVLGTVEVKILEYLKEGKDLHDALVEGKARV